MIKRNSQTTGKLRIGDDWNAITIIALSQSNPLKAVAEFVENSIDAGARHIRIIRGKEKGQHYLTIKDDGHGIRQNEEGVPDFPYVATHICDSIKRQLKQQGTTGLQGEFGIGLLSFWTVGGELTLTSPAKDGRLYQMRMRKGQPTYQVSSRRMLTHESGTELTISPLLPGIKQFSGDKIQWYLASELRDRIRQSGVDIRVIDRTARAEYRVEPRQFTGRLLHELDKLLPADRELYLEIYLNRPAAENCLGLYRAGTRVCPDIAELEPFNRAPWTSGYLQGMVSASYLNLTPGTRTGVIHDEALARLEKELEPVGVALTKIIEDQQRAEEEEASRDVLKSIQKALKEALLTLPAEEYDWFNVRIGQMRPPSPTPSPGRAPEDASEGEVLPASEEPGQADQPQRQFFEFPGPLHSVKLAPASSILPVQGHRNLRAICRDRKQVLVEENLVFHWQIVEGEGTLESAAAEIAKLTAPAEPGLTRLRVSVRQGEVLCEAEALVTITDSLLPPKARDQSQQGIPSYTFQKASGELWRSKYDATQNLIVVNSGHRDFVYTSRNKALKLRYVCRLFAKELVLKNFAGSPPDEFLERLIELSLYTEENLR